MITREGVHCLTQNWRQTSIINMNRVDKVEVYMGKISRRESSAVTLIKLHRPQVLACPPLQRDCSLPL